jgi:quercetin dioxygenase-like cupin family protein
MMIRRSVVPIALAASAALVVGIAAGRVWAAQASPQSGATSRVVLNRALPTLDGAHLENSLVEVSYPPGGSSAPHSHPCPVVGYVLSGAVRMQVKGEQEAIYKAGQSFYEAPNGVHQVSANASATEPATFLAFFTCDHKTALTVAPPK